MRATARVIRAAAVVVLVAVVLAPPVLAATNSDWSMFGWDVGRSSAPVGPTRITAGDLVSLQRRQVTIDGTVDASAIYLRGATVKGAKHDVFFVTTTYGKTLAIDADRGTVLWEFTPSSYDSVKGSYRITNATPIADPDREAIYAAAPDGMIRKLAVADGRVLWATPITRLPAREKIASPLAFFKGRVIGTTDGYIGDEPPYQGHVAVLDAATGKLLQVWNALCSNRHELVDPASCRASDAGIWGRAGVVIDAKTGNLFVATGNGPWNGVEHWGDAVIELDAEATNILGNYTPQNTEELDRSDQDLGSTSPVLTGGPYVIQGGKDGVLRVLDWRRMAGATAHRGGESSAVSTPGKAKLFTAPAVHHVDGVTWIVVANNSGTGAWVLDGNELRPRWQNDHAGTSPVITGGLVYVYDPAGVLRVYDAISGHQLAELPCGSGHWNSPIVVDGRIALPEGDANRHRTTGVIDIWSSTRRLTRRVAGEGLEPSD